MKKLRTCLVCKKPVPLTLAYTAEIEFITTNPITGDKDKQIMEGYVCPICNKNAGYKTSKKKLERFKRENK